ncbi:helix-turn-helix domain-containing protein [Merdibacter massiliensis]|uniref:helix-turn-helix domain-containing protein n=1 Tax=Merdibacter massiliensis TaxID=1871030 RepID=UPI00096AB805|nr:helix-turn-helix domain-containing protein [Merdibacter massiliensis]
MAKKSTKFNKYTPELKTKAVEDYLSDEYGGLRSICKIYGIKDNRTLRNWIRLYKQNPELLKDDGRRLGKKDGVNKGRSKKIDLDYMTKDEQLEYLKMENEILKKAKALRKIYGEH